MSQADEIVCLFDADQKSGRMARTAEDIPVRYEAITPEWLTAILCGDAPNAVVTGFSLDAADDGSSNRRRIFLEYNDAGIAAGLPRSVFCKAAIGLQNRLLLGLAGAAHAETTFYNRLRDTFEINAPTAYYARYDPRSFAAITVLRDLAGEVTFCNETTSIDLDHALSQAEQLARLHGRYFGASELSRDRLGLNTWPGYWADCLRFDMAEYCAKGFRDAEEVIPPRLFAREAEIWSATTASVDSHNTGPQMLIHSDVHLKNWYIQRNGEMGLGDWQQIVVGHWARDVGYTLATSLAVADRRAWEKDILLHYLDRLAAYGGPRVGFDEAMRAYRQQLFGALAFWTVTLTPPPQLPDMQPRATSMAFLERIAAAIDDLDAIDSF